MSIQSAIKRKTAPDIRARKNAEPIVMLTSYHAHTAALVDRYCDVILVGDSLGNVMQSPPSARRLRDMLGLLPRTAKFVRRYGDLAPVIEAAIEGYARDVRCRAFPGPEQVYGMKKS